MNDEQAVRDVVETWMRATRENDLDTVLGLMADDIVFMTAGAEPFGKPEFAAASEARGDTPVDGTADIVEVHVEGDWAWARAYISVTVTPPSGVAAHRSGYTLSIFRREGERWLLARDANLTTDPSG
jgi:uncharacterized protein (TIGR02246 family)